MAEMLVDGTKLDACNTAEADAIRAKTGGTDPIPYDFTNNKGFADAIAAIPSGGSDFSPFETYKTSFVPVDNGTSVSFATVSGKRLISVVSVVRNPSRFLNSENIGNITGFNLSNFSNYFGGKTGGFYVNHSAGSSEISVIETATTADQYSAGVDVSYNSNTGIITCSNTRSKHYIAGETYDVWCIFAEKVV